MTYADEPDAFPFRGSAVLHGIAQTSCRGHMICLTATPDEELLEKVQSGMMCVLKLNRRPHGHPVPVPHMITAPSFLLPLFLLRWLKAHREHPRMVFVPSKRDAAVMRRLLSLREECFMCTSSSADRDEVIETFRNREAGLIVSTTVLERGITVPGADICVYRADSGVFDEAGLTQMAGRAGRSFQKPDGDVLFLCGRKSSSAEACVKSIQEANR